MIRNYFKIALRVLSRHKTYVALNIIGLGFALACCLLAYLNYDYRASFDSNYHNTENIYRLNSKKITDGSVQQWGVSPLALGGTLAKSNSGIKRFARLYSSSAVVKSKENSFSERVYFADPALFDLFKFPLADGNSSQFADKNSVVISKAFAEKLFNNEQALNQKITLLNREGNEQVYTITGVLEKLPDNSSFQFDIITSFENYFTEAEQIDWRNNNQVSTFVEVTDKSSLENLERQAKTFTAVYNSSRADDKLEGFKLQPFQNIAFSSDRDFEGYVYGSPLNSNPRGVIVIGPAIMSFLILLIACFNFTNISISFASNRLKEIGIRKVLGGVRKQLIKQFLIENLILCTIASGLAILFVAALLPSFNSTSSLNLRFNLQDSSMYLFLLALPLFTAFISGLYPALYISSFKPISILKGQTTFGNSNGFTRFLLFAQFSLSCLALIVGISLTKNASYQQTVDYGYAIKELAVLQIDSASEYNILSNALKNNPRILSMAGTVHQIGEGSPTRKVQAESNEIKANVAVIGGEEYLKTTGVTLKEGRHFYTGKSLDQDASVMVNETLLSSLNIKSPLGQKIKVDSAYYTIVGVVKDYKEMGLHGKVPPMVLKSANPEDYKYLVARIPEDGVHSVFKSMQDTWHRVLPAKPFSGFTQDELVEKEVYMNEGFKSVAFFLALSTIALSASGIFALVSLNIIRRRKEIGIRKVLGASIISIISLINKDFIRLMLISFVIGSTLGFLLIDNLLFRFVYVYHPEIGVLPFILTLLIILLTSAITIGAKVYKAAVANPVKALRTE
ncbi:MAG: ABC transporter permease [Sphingobacteriaceae bacterium]|nr:ABC transporter permease [Sphingobacteriaceae bacterium]